MNKDLTKKILKFRDDRDWKQFHTPENLSKAITIEASELLECFLWSSDFEQDEVEMELADIVIYIIYLANKLDIDLEEIIEKKININEKKYPVKKSKGKSDKYTKL